VSAFPWYSGAAAAANLLANNAVTGTCAIDITADVQVEAQLSESFPANVAIDVTDDVQVQAQLSSQIAVDGVIGINITDDVGVSASLLMSVPVFAAIAIDVTLDVQVVAHIQSGAVFVPPHPANPRIAQVHQ
jgi:hypothetical protein